MGYPSDDELLKSMENRAPPAKPVYTHALNKGAGRFRCGVWVGTHQDASQVIEHPDNTAPTGAGVTCPDCHAKRLDIPAREFTASYTTPLAGDANDPIHFALSDGNTVCGVKVEGSNVRVASTVASFIDARGAGYACSACVSGSTVRYSPRAEAEAATKDAPIAGRLKIDAVDMAKGPDRTAVVVYDGENKIVRAEELPRDALTTDAGKALKKLFETGVPLGPVGSRCSCGGAPHGKTCALHENIETKENDVNGNEPVNMNSLIEEGVRRARSLMFPHGGLRPTTEAHLRRLLTEGRGIWLHKPTGSGRTTARALHYLVTGKNPDVLPEHVRKKLPNEVEAIMRAAAYIETPPSVASHAINVTHEPEGGAVPRVLHASHSMTVPDAEAAKAKFEETYPTAGKAPAEPAAASEGMKPGVGTIHYLDVEKREGRICKTGSCAEKVAARGLCLKHYGEERGITDETVNAIDAAEERAREEGRTAPFGGACGTCHATLRPDGYCPECRAHVLGARKAETAPTIPSADAARPASEAEGASTVTKLPTGEKLAEGLQALASDHGFPDLTPGAPEVVHLERTEGALGWTYCGIKNSDVPPNGPTRTTSRADATCLPCEKAIQREKAESEKLPRVNASLLVMADDYATQAREMADEDDPRGFKRARLYRAAAKLMEAYAEVAEIEGLDRIKNS